MTTLTLHITNQDILPALIDTLKRFNGVSIVDPTDCTFTDPTLLDKNYGSRSKKGEFLRFELSHNALNRKPRK